MIELHACINGNEVSRASIEPRVAVGRWFQVELTTKGDKFGPNVELEYQVRSWQGTESWSRLVRGVDPVGFCIGWLGPALSLLTTMWRCG